MDLLISHDYMARIEKLPPTEAYEVGEFIDNAARHVTSRRRLNKLPIITHLEDGTALRAYGDIPYQAIIMDSEQGPCLTQVVKAKMVYSDVTGLDDEAPA